MRTLLQHLLKKPIAWLAEKLSSSPHKKDVFASLNDLEEAIRAGKKNRGLIREFDPSRDRYIIFSDQHKGTRDENDDFRKSEKNYLAALQYYYEQGFHFISLGDCEELWKYTPDAVMKNNDACFEAEKKFLDLDRYYRTFGNHDLMWKFKLQRNIFLRPVFGKSLRVYEGLILKTIHNRESFSIFLTHGHQGDRRSDGNSFSLWVVANIWTPIQRYLNISINTPATSFELRDKHNIMMYEWSAAQNNLVFISGHTHKPVFASQDHVQRVTKQFNEAKPSYFNSGCCCFDDGDITGIEIADACIRLIKWDNKDGTSKRIVLEESLLSSLFDKLIS